MLQSACWVRDVWSEHGVHWPVSLTKADKAQKAAQLLWSQCNPTFWEGGRSLKKFLAVMLSLIQKSKSFLPFCLGNPWVPHRAKRHCWPTVEAKSCTESAAALRSCTPLSRVTYTHANRCSGWEAGHPHVIIICPLIERKLYRDDQYIWYLDISGSPALRFFSESSDHISPQL